MEFKTASYRSGLVGLLAAAALAAGAISLANTLFAGGSIGLRQPLAPLTLGLSVVLLLDLVVLLLLLYRAIAALRLHYRLDRNGLVIYWGGSRLIVPMERIEAVEPVADQAGARGEGLWSELWAGLLAGRARLAGNRPAHLRTTLPLARSIAVLTPDGAYVVSPREPDAFIEAWRVRRPLGPTQHWREEEQRARFLSLPIWRDRLAWGLMALGLAANLALQVYLALVFNQLSAILPFHFDALGRPDRLGDRAEILRLPQVALLLLAIDLILGLIVYRRERLAAYLIWGGGLILQLLIWGALRAIMG
jgi:Bacterial PH domain